ncbi:uncharacterized protein LOC132904277 [Amyelois transitella]|uniref:uncharacterized protein LOC132904277 n=1 Tax=Amyelois transitella TaxID=680683 RepID=UPI00298FD9A3|nr:uncharacterized protein LOC132904277 [Amyelois transitella]
MFDTEKLIFEVEQRPCLWNLSEKSYSDKFLKQKAWQEVAENCFEEWNNLSNEDKEKKIHFLQKKWKTVRDYYTREKKKENEERSGSAAKKKKPCPYFDLLQFLKVTKQSRNSFSNVTSPENTDNDNDDSNITGNNDDEDPDEQSRSTEADSPLYQPSTSQPASMQKPVYENQPSTSKQTVPSQPETSVSRTKNKKQTLTLFQESLLKKFDNDDDKDRNRLFLLSFLPEMSKMTEKQNFEFRMELMKALNKVKYQIPEQHTQSNWPHFSSPFSDSHSSNQYYPTPVNRGYTTQANEYHSNEINEYDET